MGQKLSKKSHQPLIQIILFSRKLNLYNIPETFQDFEMIAFSFHYAYCDTLLPFELLTYTYTSRGFLRQNLEITNKKSYKKAIKNVGNDPLQITINVEQNQWMSSLKFKKTSNEDLKTVFSAIIEVISQGSEDILGTFEAYSRLLKISHQYCQYISTHSIKSSIFGVLMIVISDACKCPAVNRFVVSETHPYIEFNSEVLSESSSDALRVWNDFIFYLPKALKSINLTLEKLETSSILLKSSCSNEKNRSRYNTNYQTVYKSIRCVKNVQARLVAFEDSIRDYAANLKKPDMLSHIIQVSTIISSSGGSGIDSLMNLFSITPINKFPSN